MLDLKNKSPYFIDHISVHIPDIVAITETWLMTKDDAVRTECTPPGYNLFDQVRQTPRHGGCLAIPLRNMLTANRNPTTHQSSFGSVDWTLCGNTRIRIILIYRPPFQRITLLPSLSSSVNYLSFSSQRLSTPNHLLLPEISASI